MEGQSSPVPPTDLESLRAQAARAGVAVTDADLEAVRGFLDAILPELARIEAGLELDEAP